MTDTPYRITADPVRHYLRVVQYGFWTVEITRRFADDFAKAFNDMAADSDDILLLLHQIALEVQSIEVTEMLGRLAVASHPKPRKVAVVADKAMVRIQGKRLTADSSNMWFETETQALAWLFSGNAAN